VCMVGGGGLVLRLDARKERCEEGAMRGKEGRREGGKEGRREGGKEGTIPPSLLPSYYVTVPPFLAFPRTTALSPIPSDYCTIPHLLKLLYYPSSHRHHHHHESASHMSLTPSVVVAGCTKSSG